MIKMKWLAKTERRIDQELVNVLDASRSKIEKHIKEGHVKVNDKVVKKSYFLALDDLIEVDEIEPEEQDIEAENIPLDIVYEDEDVVVVNKPNGMVVHPAPGHYQGTLVNALLYHFKDLSKINGQIRPGIVHRIDAYTTGLLMVAKNDFAHAALAEQLENKTTTRKYIALVWGVIPNDSGTINAPIGRDANNRKKMCVTDKNAKEAVTHFKVLERYKEATKVELRLETGRTHQIRVHMAYIGYPVVNDPVYGRRKVLDDTGQCLHAQTIGFVHPKTKKYLEFSSVLPTSFTNIENKLKI